jgi:hypothetical protein
MKYLVLILLSLTSCTITLTNTSANGRASDTVDEASTASANVQPNVSLPLR